MSDLRRRLPHERMYHGGYGPYQPLPYVGREVHRFTPRNTDQFCARCGMMATAAQHHEQGP